MNEFDEDDLKELDIENCPINELWKYDVDRLETQLYMLESEHRLCGGTGEDVIAEFGFKGDYGSVLVQLRQLLDYVKENPYDENDRSKVLNRLDKFAEYVHNKCDPYHDEILKCVKKHTMDGLNEAVELAAHKKSLSITLHDKKECLCYTN